MNHEHGWRTGTADYVDTARASLEAAGSTDGLFRPPYGKLTRAQAKGLRAHAQVVMWDVLSGDFAARGDRGIRRVPTRLKRHTRPGSIVVFHDSLKCEDAARGLAAIPVLAPRQRMDQRAPRTTHLRVTRLSFLRWSPRSILSLALISSISRR